MKKNIKLIALDMDGTLVNDDGGVSDENAATIKKAKEKGIHVVLSTGRPLDHCREIDDLLGRSSYIITVNGGEIYDENFTLVDSNPLEASHVRRLWEMTKEHDVHFWSTTKQGRFNSREPFEKEVEDYEWLKYGFDIVDDAARERVLEELHANPELEVTNSSPTNIEVNAIGVNKAAALAKVCKWLDITMDNVMACGDSLNDIAMIRESGFGVAMGNAQDVVKDAADWVTATNVEHGVARAIEKVLES
ncbi:Cof-type HAD-IIB family hydrolase [Thalassobacillus hwangdonensis]|uniref:Cof-type HAD-IIB family hydrolase n=1 Tax=Thalassobacillus hwangdonensis TaxID=546108 RepID=A0ABW3L668_9BACI